MHVGSSLAGDSSVPDAMPEPEERESKMPKHSCALRALTICDGQVLEHPDRALTWCLCEQIEAAERRLSDEVIERRRAERQRLIEKALSEPALPF